MKPRIYYRTRFNYNSREGYKVWEIEVHLHNPYQPEEIIGGFFRKHSSDFPAFRLAGQSDRQRTHTIANSYGWKVEISYHFNEEIYKILKPFVGKSDTIKGMMAALHQLKAERFIEIEIDNNMRRIPYHMRQKDKAEAYAKAIDAGLRIAA